MSSSDKYKFVWWFFFVKKRHETFRTRTMYIWYYRHCWRKTLLVPPVNFQGRENPSQWIYHPYSLVYGGTFQNSQHNSLDVTHSSYSSFTLHAFEIELFVNFRHFNTYTSIILYFVHVKIFFFFYIIINVRCNRAKLQETFF